jgi:NAD(P) transhydrogenase subunit alpha
LVRIGVPRESRAGERRVSLVPEAVAKLTKSGHELAIETGAGTSAGFPDDAYVAVGARLADRPTVWKADLVVTVGGPEVGDLDGLAAGALLVGFLAPLDNPRVVTELARRRVNAIAMELIPRITRAQSMDALSSQATVSGYLAALLAATNLPRFFPMLTTAAGTIPPAKVLVVGAGVAGLQAIATARRLGAVVTGYDTRAAAKEQVLSLGAKFVDIELGTADTEGTGGYAKALGEDALAIQREALGNAVADADAVVTTALVPGQPAPRLISEDSVKRMRPGSVIVDLAAERGGNCELTVPGQTVVSHGVSIIGPVNLASQLPAHASQMYSRNVAALLGELIVEGRLVVDLYNEVVSAALVTYNGEVRDRS